LADTPVLDHTAVGIRSRRPRSFARGYLRRYPHSVAQRTVEIGIRIAMGASPARVTGLMLRYGLLPVLCGMAFGWSGAFAISRFFSALLFDVRAARPPDVAPRFRLHARCGVHRER